MKRPVTIWVVSLLLGSYGIFLLSAATESIDWISLAVGLLGALALVGCVALFLRKRWSQYFVYSFALLLVAIWIQEYVWSIEPKHWLHNEHVRDSSSLIPGVAIVLGCIAASIATFMFFRSSHHRT